MSFGTVPPLAVNARVPVPVEELYCTDPVPKPPRFASTKAALDVVPFTPPLNPLLFALNVNDELALGLYENVPAPLSVAANVWLVLPVIVRLAPVPMATLPVPDIAEKVF